VVLIRDEATPWCSLSNPLLKIIVPHEKLLRKGEVSNYSIKIVSKEKGKHETVRKKKGFLPNTYISMPHGIMIRDKKVDAQ
jgi:hypothetical protein